MPYRIWLQVVFLIVLLSALEKGLRGEEAKAAGNQEQWCFAWVQELPQDMKDRGSLLRGAKWDPGKIITVSFLDGDPVVQKKVIAHAKKWCREAGGPANLTFNFQDQRPTQIRISFKYKGSWSVLGKSCELITDQTQPTMNYGWLKPETPDQEYQRVVLHEFGHAIGMVHEHQNPAGGINWNKMRVIQDLSGPPNNWPLDTIERNMFQPVAKNESNYTQTDKDSIMMYPIPPGWTKDGFTAGLNTNLSATDRQFIGQQYP